MRGNLPGVLAILAEKSENRHQTSACTKRQSCGSFFGGKVVFFVLES
jgi:hypothetical protein